MELDTLDEAAYRQAPFYVYEHGNLGYPAEAYCTVACTGDVVMDTDDRLLIVSTQADYQRLRNRLPLDVRCDHCGAHIWPDLLPYV